MSPTPFTILIPARIASTRLPNKPLADIAGVPMIVRVAQRVRPCQAKQVVVACDSERILEVCQQHGVRAILTDEQHPSGTDRLAQAAQLLGLGAEEIVVNVQGDEPLIDPKLVLQVGQLLLEKPDLSISTAATPIDDVADFLNPNVVKVVLGARGHALYFSRAPIPFARDETPTALPAAGALRHIGLYAFRVGFLQSFPSLPMCGLEQTEKLEQLRALYNGHLIGVVVTPTAPAAGVDTAQDLERVRNVFACQPV